MYVFYTIVRLMFLISFARLVMNTTITFWSGSEGKGKSKKYIGTDLHRKCMLVPEFSFQVRSITTDTCILFFPTTKCVGRTMNFIDSTTVNWPTNGPKVQSWIPCRQKALNVTIYSNSDLDRKPFATFTNLCKCINIPKQLQNAEIYVNTEYEEVFLYSKKDCMGQFVSSYGGKTLKISLEPSSRPSTCPILMGVLTGILNFTQTKSPKIVQMPLEVTPKEIRSLTLQNVSVKVTGEDRKYLTFSAFPWTRHLLSCKPRNESILEYKLWVGTWENDTKFRNDFIESHCETRDPINGIYADQRKMINQTFVLMKNISVPTGLTTVYASRGYVTKYFDYKVLLNITGITINTDIVSASNLENSLPQNGLRFVRKLDAFTVLAEAAASVRSHYPISTKYWTDLKVSPNKQT